jgi:NAD(P)-dependent dehydrogenase (short-subunit alcohol dehydrogenase family)
MTPPIYDEIVTTNLKAIYFLSQQAMPQMVKSGGGKIINIGSVTSAVGLNDVSVYGMTKGGLALLTKTMAVEWAPANIQVNCLCPGFIATELTVPLWESSRADWILARVPAKRPGEPRDLVGMAIYLAAPASDFTTGQAIYVDGGFTAGNAW